MLKIDSNGVIRLSRGDDVKFPVFINMGTTTAPIRYYIQGPFVRMEKTGFPDYVKVKFNDRTWMSKVGQEDGTYIFSYVVATSEWSLTFGETTTQNVIMSQYGITFEGTLTQNCTLTVVYNLGDESTETFYLFRINNIDSPIFRKVFSSNTDLWRGTSENYFEDPEVGPTGDMKITLLGTDNTLLKKKDGTYITLAELEPGEYIYQIKGNLLDRFQSTQQQRVYGNVTITNRLPLYLINDNYDRAWEVEDLNE